MVNELPPVVLVKSIEPLLFIILPPAPPNRYKLFVAAAVPAVFVVLLVVITVEPEAILRVFAIKLVLKVEVLVEPKPKETAVLFWYKPALEPEPA